LNAFRRALQRRTARFAKIFFLDDTTSRALLLLSSTLDAESQFSLPRNGFVALHALHAAHRRVRRATSARATRASKDVAMVEMRIVVMSQLCSATSRS